MKIISGISSSNSEAEISAYVTAGVDEFFIGYVPPQWSDVYGFEVSCNRREHAKYNYQTLGEIENVVNFIHKAGRKVYLALNAHEYTAEQIKLLTRILDDVRHVGFDAFIVSNIALMLELREKKFELPFNISIGAGGNSAESMLFYKKHIPNTGRMVLPRKLTLNEIEDTAKRLAGSGISLEAFGLADACFFNDEYCFSWHSAANKSFCRSPLYKHREASPLLMGPGWKRELKPENYQKIVNKRFSILTEIESEQEEYQKKHKSHSQSVKDANYYSAVSLISSCGLCAIQKFKEWGIDAIKLPLRGGSYQLNVEIVKMVKKVIDNPKATPAFCQSLINSPLFCSGKHCYYNFPFEN